MKPMAICAAVVVGTWSVATAHGGLFEDIYRGLDILATPSGYPLSTTVDGTRVNGQRSGRLRILPDRVGRGYTLEFDRAFGTDSRGRPEILDLGAYELELSGATQATLGFTRRGMLVGSGEFRTGDINYSLRAKSGFQDVELRGVYSAQGALEINEFGFYTVNLDVSNNTSQLLVDGVLARGDTDTNFDIGPISIKGNLFYDGLVALLAGLGVDTTPLEELFPASPIDDIIDSFQRQVNFPELVAGVEYYSDGQLPLAPSAAASTFASTGLAGSTNPAAQGSLLIPEPGSLLLLAVGGALLWGRYRR